MTSTRWLRSANLMLAWAFAKLAVLYAWVFHPGEYSDTYYYFLQAQKVAALDGGLAQMTPEYPTPAAAILMTPWWLGMQDYDSYRLGFIVIITAFDLLFTLLLVTRASTMAVVAWLFIETMSATLPLLRFDLIPAVAAGAAVLLILTGREHRAGPLVAIGASVKLWPALLFPLLLGRRETRKRSAISFVVTGVVLVAASLAAAGWDRLVSPLGFQKDRGLQIESVAATIPMVQRLTDHSFGIFYSKWNAFEVSGPTIPALARAAGVASVIALLVMVWLIVRWWRDGADPERAAYLALFMIAAFIVTSKALSPQYFLWLAAPGAVLFGMAWKRPELADPQRATASYLVLVAIGLLTIYVYPMHYDDLLYDRMRSPLQALVARNVLLVAYTIWTAVVAARRTPRGSFGADPAPETASV